MHWWKVKEEGVVMADDHDARPWRDVTFPATSNFIDIGATNITPHIYLRATQSCDKLQHSIMTTTTVPTISTTLSLSPQHHIQGEESPTLTITLNLSAPAPITIFTFFGIFNPQLALRRRNFTAHDMSTGPPIPINLEITKGGKRGGFQRRKGSRDERYYVTLHPGVDHQIQCPFNVVKMTARVTGLPVFQGGHGYRLGITEGEKIRRWWWGTLDDVLLDEEESYERSEPPGGEVPIDICADPIDFEVKEAWSATSSTEP
jgi:hypothetical protein